MMPVTKVILQMTVLILTEQLDFIGYISFKYMQNCAFIVKSFA